MLLRQIFIMWVCTERPAARVVAVTRLGLLGTSGLVPFRAVSVGGPLVIPTSLEISGFVQWHLRESVFGPSSFAFAGSEFVGVRANLNDSNAPPTLARPKTTVIMNRSDSGSLAVLILTL